MIDKGRKRARRAGAFCRLHELVPYVADKPVGARPRDRLEFARTALALEAVVVPWLDLGRASDILDELAAYRSFGKVCLVGHEPDLSMLASLLLGCPGDGVRVRKASLIGIECAKPIPGRGQLLSPSPTLSSRRVTDRREFFAADCPSTIRPRATVR